MPDTVDALDLADGCRLAVVAEGDDLAAVPMVRDSDGWRRAVPGDGAAAALLELIAGQHGPLSRGNFRIRPWASRRAVGERPMGVDQTNESVVVGDVAVVKWATHLQEGPHPAPSRITALNQAGFTGMPAPWGLITWSRADADETVVAYVDEFLPDAVDGWTWAVDLVTGAARGEDPATLAATITDVGSLIADMHAALPASASHASPDDAARWHRQALDTLEIACDLTDSMSGQVLRTHRDAVAAELACLGDLAGMPVLDGHGDLHVGQILRSGNRLVVTDFDGNPVLPAAQRILPIPAVLDVAGMAQSLAHVSVVARKYATLDTGALAAVETAVRTTFLDAYQHRLAALGYARLFDARPLPAFRLQQVMREMIYAARHLPRWMYVPDSALPALLDEGASS
ncbi:glucosamine kinase [Mycobacterium sp. 236(2023)]|uniref:glucosamine kinase n=1 Tax=Mycobacterium sp. 236(2023) TaxID=3038163 RepID=UPI002414DC73|nr:glucosamine kinase [Mycobacterium sp. 236(2023)]MDG4666653.1 glucosamine kinase [Mycobacterium sp. 236(2023)]